MKRKTIILCALTLFVAIGFSDWVNAESTELKTGDIIFHTSRSSQSRAIQIATKSKYSHMGMIVLKDGSPMVFEAVSTVRLTPLKQWIARGENGHYVVKRLIKAESILTPAAINKMETEAGKYLGKRYDPFFEWTDTKQYCSEIVWKVYYRALEIKLCDLAKMKDFDTSHPLVKQKIKQRFKEGIPLDEQVVSPEQIFKSEKLMVITSK